MLKLLKNLKPYTWAVILVGILLFLRALSELYLPTLMSDIVDVGIISGDLPYIWKTGGIMLLVTIIGSACAILGRYISSRAATGFSRDIRRRVFHRVTSFSLNEFDEIGTSSMITRTTNDINQIQNAVNMILWMMLYAPMMGIGGIVMAVNEDPPLSVVLVVVIPLIIVIVVLVGMRALPKFQKIQKSVDALNRVLRESLIGVRVIRAFNRVTHERERFDQANSDLMKVSVSVNKLMAVMMPLMMLIFNFTTIAIIWFGSLRIDAGGMQIGSLMAFIQYVMRIMHALIMMTMMFIMIPRASVSAVRINAILNKEPDIRDPEGDMVKIPVKRSEKDGETGIVEFRNVSFSYHGAEEPALCGISFKAERGKVTAIIGGTGAGKSTLVNLIPRFYDIQEGEVLIDGVNVRNIPQHELRGRIGLVSQKSVLFSGTVEENIRFGVPDADDATVTRAAETAQAAGFVNEMENGYRTEISQGGTNVSGGQKQRLAIARALAGNREIYLFDDSFSALDFKTDAALRKAVREETSGSAMILVSQRVSTVMQADTIIVMDDGRIVGQGSHDELLDSCPLYKEIAESQLKMEDLA